MGITLHKVLQRICKIEYYRRILQAEEMSLRHANSFVSQNNRNNKDSMLMEKEKEGTNNLNNVWRVKEEEILALDF